MRSNTPSKPPTQTEITSLYTYPVKSLRGVAISEIEIGPAGIPGDRRWAVIGPDGRRLSARKYPRLAMVGVAIEAGTLVLSHAGSGEIVVGPPETESGPVKLTDSLVDGAARKASTAVNAWISTVMDMDCQLVQMSACGARGLALFPIHLVSLRSLADLNRRCSAPVPETRFRPNIVVRGTDPYEEDRWTRLSVDEMDLRVLDLTDRCSVPNIDPDSGTTSAEPLKTLAGFRRSGKRVNFGVYVAPTATGKLRIDMKMSAVSV